MGFEECIEMSLRKAFADTLRYVRDKREMSQQDISGAVDPSYVSKLEAAVSSPTIEVSGALAAALGIHPLSLLALAYSADELISPEEILLRVRDDLQRNQLLDVSVDRSPSKVHPIKAKGNQTTRAVQVLKRQGKSQAEAARELGISTSTVGRHWHR